MNHENKYNIHSVDDGYLLLAGMVVRRELDYYKDLLQKCRKRPEQQKGLRETIQGIERNLCTDYYHYLTLGAVDFPAYLECLHEKYEIPWEVTTK